MIKIDSTYGKKEFFINRGIRVLSYVQNFQAGGYGYQYLPNSQRQIPSNFKMRLTNVLTKNKVVFNLEDIAPANPTQSRGSYFSFVLGDGTGGTIKLEETGYYEYELVSYKGQKSEVQLMCTGLLYIYNKDTFDDEYYDKPIIPTITHTVYKPN